jgi:hypothetical protein
MLFASRYPTSPCGPRGFVRRRVVLSSGYEVGGRPVGGEGKGGEGGREGASDNGASRVRTGLQRP